MSEGGFLDSQLSQRTKMFGLRLWVVMGIGVGGFTLLILFLLSLRLFASSRSKSKKAQILLPASTSIKKHPIPLDIIISNKIPPVSKDIKEVVVESASHDSFIAPSHRLPQSLQLSGPTSSQWSRRISINAAALERMPTLDTVVKHPLAGRSVASENIWDGEKEVVTFEYTSSQYEVTPHFHTVKSKPHLYENSDLMQMHVIKHHQKNNIQAHVHESTAGNEAIENAAACIWGALARGGWGQCYTLAELEVATNQFAEKNIVGKGGYGIVYQGLLPHGSPIAVKNLLNSRGQAEKEFRVEVEVIGRVRHKNLVRLLGYCAEGSHRLLVYEYVNNGNLDQWLHGSLGKMDPLPWDARMKMVLGIAKGLAYLHEDLEPKVVHRDVKSSNILVDNDWNAKISDFGLAKLLGAGMSHVTTRVMGTFGYVAPEYASTGLLTERSDVYSFGVLMMELITGRDPVDYSRPVGEINLVDWMKMMVGSRRSDEVGDPRLREMPSSRALKRALLVAIRCVDPDALKRPRMGHIVHMLEADDVAFHNVCRSNMILQPS